MRERRSRRELFTGWLDAVRSSTAAPRRPTVIDPRRVLRPPGALVPEPRFLEACTGCGDCVSACPKDAIFMFSPAEGTTLPGIRPSARPCFLCDDLPCITACPDGALEDPGGPIQVRIGIARVDPRLCVTFFGRRCDRCVQICPVEGAITRIGNRPLVASGACTGCGLCEHVCPEEPRAITVVAERLLVSGLRVPKDEIAGK